MSKKYNIQYFALSIENNNQIVFYCYTTNTKNGFCHTVITINNSIFGNKLVTDTKSSYYNRTWERYDYENTLKRACEKIGREIYKKAFYENKLNRTY